MTKTETAPIAKMIFDAMCLNHFARAERLDVLRELLIGNDCYTTHIVREELRKGLTVHPILHQALELDWLNIAPLDSMPALQCFAMWVKRIGAGERNLGEASVFAAAQLHHAIAITDDQEAVRVGRRYGLAIHGTIWLLARACRSGKLTEAAASNLVEMLRDVDMRLPCTGMEFSSFVRKHGLL